MKKILFILLILILLFNLTGCSSNKSDINKDGVISGQVLGVMDREISNATIKITDQAGETVIIETDKNGKFQKNNLKGTYEISAAKDNFVFDTHTKTVTAGDHVIFNGQEKLILKDNVKIVGENIDLKIIDITKNQIIIDTVNENNLINKHDIIISDQISNIAEMGIFRKVEKITIENNQTIIETSSANLNEAISKGSFSEMEGFHYKSSVNSQNVSSDKKEESSTNIKEFKIANGITINGEITFTDFDVTIEGNYDNGVESFLFKLDNNQVNKLEMILNSKFETKIEKKYINKKLPPIKFVIPAFVGPVPVAVPIFINPNLNLIAGIEGSASLNSKIGITRTMKSELGFKYFKETGFEKISNKNSKYNFIEPSINGEVDVKGYIKPELSFEIYDIAGPKIGLVPELNFKGNTNANIENPEVDLGWDLTAGIFGEIGAKADFFGVENNYSLKIEMINKNIAKGINITTKSDEGGEIFITPNQKLYTVSELLDQKASVELKGEPNSGYEFKHWEINNNNVLDDNPYDLNFNENTIIKGVFYKQETNEEDNNDDTENNSELNSNIYWQMNKLKVKQTEQEFSNIIPSKCTEITELNYIINSNLGYNVNVNNDDYYLLYFFDDFDRLDNVKYYFVGDFNSEKQIDVAFEEMSNYLTNLFGEPVIDNYWMFEGNILSIGYYQTYEEETTFVVDIDKSKTSADEITLLH